MELAISRIVRTLHYHLKQRCKGMQRLAKLNLDRPGISIYEGDGEIALQRCVLSVDLMHETGLRFCGRMTARYWNVSVSFNSVSRSWLLNASNLRAAISTAIRDVCFLVSS
jgi:hypothetical protein